MSIEVSGLYTYPIKGCRAVSHETIETAGTGLEHDRQWVIVDARSKDPITQREEPELATIVAAVKDETLTVEVPLFGCHDIDFSKPSGNLTKYEITLFKKTGAAVSEGEAVSELLSGYFGKKVLLMRIVEPRALKSECVVAGMNISTGFADGFPLLLTSENSLAKLNAHLDEPVGMDRFRPNIVVRSDTAEAYDEDHWRNLRINGLFIQAVRACARCVIPDIDQDTGRCVPSKPVLRALAATRRGIDPVNNKPGVFFGQNVVHAIGRQRTLRVGAAVEVVSRTPMPNFRPVTAG